jgi:7,8-dihydroneopterin aldolase/epimerase/oxygenase
MSSDMRWRINIRDLATTIRVGIHEHEKTPQRVLVNGVIEVDYAARPQSIKECFDYDHIHRLVVKEWPARPHTPLLETWVSELLEYIFRADARVAYAKASVCKPDIFAEAEAVGVEAEWTRADFERLSARK